MDAGEAVVYLRGEAERDLQEAETYIESFSKDGAVKVLDKLCREIYQLARNLRRNKAIPENIPANLQICYNNLNDLSGDARRKIEPSLSAAAKKAVQGKLLRDLITLTKKIRTVESLLVQLEKEGQRKPNDRQRMSA